MAPTGKRASADYVYVMEFDDGKIRHMTKIWNAGLTMRELGWASSATNPRAVRQRVRGLDATASGHPGRGVRRSSSSPPHSPKLGDAAAVTLIDENDAFVFGDSKLDVMLGRTTPEAVRLPPCLPTRAARRHRRSSTGRRSVGQHRLPRGGGRVALREPLLPLDGELRDDSVEPARQPPGAVAEEAHHAGHEERSGRRLRRSRPPRPCRRRTA